MIVRPQGITSLRPFFCFEGTMVDDLLNTPNDNPSIGLLICKERNAVLARYALSRINAPIGISKYELAQQQLPKDVQAVLPSVEEIENELNNKDK